MSMARSLIINGRELFASCTVFVSVETEISFLRSTRVYDIGGGGTIVVAID